MRLGLIARADNSGLGMQTWEFFNHMHPSKTLVVDMSGHNGNRQYIDRFPGAVWSYGIPNIGTINEFLQDLDVIFVAEAPYNYMLYERAKELGVKVAVQYNYEFFDWFKYPQFPLPDMLIAPSTWNYEVVDQWARERGVQHVYLHCPVNRDKIPFRKIEKFTTFLHVVGRAAAHDRNGTMSVIRAAQFLRGDAKIKIHFQGQQGVGHQVTHTIDDYLYLIQQVGNFGHLEWEQTEFDDYNEVYNQGDVLLLPRRYGGNCLPMNEALSAGMPVLMPNISPNDKFLDSTWLLPAYKVGEFEPRTVIDIYDVDPYIIALKVNEFSEMPPEQAGAHNYIADKLADRISWETLKPKYLEVLEGLCQSP